MIPSMIGGSVRKPASPNDATAVAGQTLTDSLGNFWGINGSAVVTFNGATFGFTSSVTGIAYVNGRVWQNTPYGWYPFTVTNGVVSWDGTGPFTDPLPTITGITLSNNTFANAAPVDTVVGTLGVTATSGSFSFVLGSLSVSGAASGQFKIAGGNTLALAIADPPGTYSVPIVAAQNLLNASPFSQTFTVTGSGTVANTESPPGSDVPGNVSSINASPTPGTAGSGNVITLTGAQIAINGTVIGGTAVTELYYIGDTCFQYGNGAWYGPVKIGSTGSSVPADPHPTISLSNSTISSTGASGVVVGGLSVAVGAGSYTWAYSLSGPNAGAFTVLTS